LIAVAALGASLVAAAPASAQIEFAVFTPVPGSMGGAVNFSDNGAGTLASVSASTPTVFAFDVTPLANFGNLSSTFNFSATQDGPATTDAAGTISTTFDGSFNYYYAGPNVTNGGVTLTTGELLLGGTFSNASFSGTAGSSGGGLEDDSLTGTVTYSSGISSTALPLATTGESFSFGFIEISPVLAVQPSGDLRSFLTIGSGTFSSNLSTTGGGGGVPEPAAWALMLIGLGGVGAAMRRRARLASA
jgi:hypothetical protein